MVFRLARSKTFDIKVEVEVINEKGVWTKDDFIATFLRAEDAEEADLLKLENKQLVESRLQGWTMKDEQRQDVPFTPENLQSFLSLTSAVREAAIAFWRGNVGAKEKN